jgi:hypothetical protein
MQFSSLLRWVTTGAFVVSAVGFAVPVEAQIRQQIADKAAVQAANDFVTKINGQNCTDFAATLSQMKQGSNAGSMSAKLKANPEARTKYVNIVGGPLLNKMINCNLVPGM